MKKAIKNFIALPPQTKSSVSALISAIWNSVLATGKLALSIFKGIFFLVSGVINIFFALAKLECHWGLKNYHNQSFKYRNIKVASFLLVAGIQYSIYMLSLIFWNRTVMQYTDFLSINIALIAFVELGFAIKGMFDIKDKGHYYRDIKLINLCSTFTSLMWAEVALLSFTTGSTNMLYCGISGAVVGLVIICISIYIFFAPKVSLIDRKYNSYKKVSKDIPDEFAKDIKLTLSKSKIFGDYIYTATKKNDIIDGQIIRGRNAWHTLNIYYKIAIILFSEILIFAYGICAIIYFFKNLKLIKKLDSQMLELGYEKISTQNETQNT
ncbi:MAG: hypothetical protein IJW59_00550 [Clostridia bacterium]|nr:hypothetical protein [Clostridia bacterium]